MMNTRYIAAELRLSHWSEIMRERKESGLSIKAFCESRGFHTNVYFYWQRKLREAVCEHLETADTRLTVSGFTEVSLEVSEDVRQHEAPGQVRIEIGGVNLSADCRYPPDKLAALIRELMQS